MKARKKQGSTPRAPRPTAVRKKAVTAPVEIGVVTARTRPGKVRRSKKDTGALQRAKRVLARYKDQLLAIPGVVGVEVCRKVTRGEVTATYAITVLVRRKIHLGNLNASDVIPRSLGEVPLDVQPVGFTATACSWLGTSLRKRRPALIGGLLIGDAGAGTEATLTAMVRGSDGQALMGLTAGHAVSDAGTINQPAGSAASNAVGRVIDIEMSELMDAAVFQIDPRRRPAAGGVAGFGGPAKLGSVSSTTDFIPVVMAGACSGWVYGQARRSKGPFQVDYGQGPTELRDQIIVYPVPSGREFNRGGDSGAMLLSADGSEALGMVIAALMLDGGVGGVGLATPLDRVLSRFGVNLLEATV